MLTAGTTKFTYDKNGNRLTEVGSSGTTTHAYDANNRLLSVAAPGGTSTFTYDGDGNRISQTTPSGTYDYVNDTAASLPVVLNEKGPDGTIDYAYGLGLLESSSSGFNYFYNLDGLGSVTNLTTASGAVLETYSYDAWGNALTATGNVGTKNKFRFTGQALDPATGLYFLSWDHKVSAPLSR
jgi:YD repeat-containing protein